MDKRKTRNLISLALVVALIGVGGWAVYGAGRNNKVSFSDVPKDHWAYENIYRMAEAGVINGYENGEFAPEAQVSRAEFIKMFMTELEIKPDEIKPPSKNKYDRDKTEPTNDMLCGSGELQSPWYAGYVTKGYRMGLFDMENLHFVPSTGYYTIANVTPMDQPITRDDVATLLKAVNAEVVFLGGYPDGEFHGYWPLSRAEAATVICRLEDYILSVTTVNGKTVRPAKGQPRVELASYVTPVKYQNAREALKGEHFIVHGGGTVLGYDNQWHSVTNSAEALENAYIRGNRVVELDFLRTIDKKIYCLHDDYKFWLADGTLQSGIGTREEILSGRSQGGLTPLTLEGLVDFMRLHPDLYVVTDTKTAMVYLLDAINEMAPDVRDRFIVQIYEDNDYNVAKSRHFDNIIYTLYRHSKDIDALRSFAYSHDLTAFTFDQSLWSWTNWRGKLAATGVPICIHTVDGDSKYQYVEGGALAVYTNDTRN